MLNIFDSSSGLISVEIPNSVTSIGSQAFYKCSSLTSVTIPNSVTSIGNSAFYNCSSLTSVTLNSNAIVSREYMKYLFGDQVTEYIIGDDVTSIGGSAFSGCYGLTSVTIGNSVTSIGENAFYNCSDLTSVTIPNSVTSIGGSAFYNCYGLTSVTIGNSVTSIGHQTFCNCYGLTSVTIPNSVTSIYYNAFYNCYGLTSVTIPNSVTSIYDHSFYNCYGLTSVTIPNSVTSIGEEAFYNTRLKSVTIGSGVLSIGSNVFGFDSSKGDKPVKVIWLTNTPPTGYSYAAGMVNYVSSDSYTNLSNKKVYPFLSSMFEVDGVRYVPVSPSERTCDAIDCAYNESAENINIGKSVSYQGIAMTVKYVNEYVCYQNGFIKEINLSFEGNLGNNAFESCTLLKSAILENIISIGNYAFSGCSSLQSITIPNAATSIGDHGFSDCSSMASVKIGSGVITIGTYAFNNCSALSQIVIPQSVTKIDNYAFYGCTSLANINMEDRNSDDTALTLGSNGSDPLFSSCPLDEVYIGRNISYPTESYSGYSPFYRNTSLKTVTITNKETEISPNEFYGCTSLKNVTIGDGVTTIGDWAFSGCSSLDYFACGSQVANIGKEAFSDCTAMTKLISRAATPPVCGAQALDDINKWNCKLQVPEASIPSYQAADQWKEFFFIEPTGIQDVKYGKIEGVKYYDLNGNQSSQARKGLNIVRMSNGKTKKVLVK